MNRVPRASSATQVRTRKPQHLLAAVGALSILLCICVPVTSAAAQAGSAAPPAPVVAQRDVGALLLELDRLLAEDRKEEAESIVDQLLESRADAVSAGLELVSRQGESSELTVRSVCDLASDEVPLEMSTSVLDYVLPSPSLDDWTKRHCIRVLSKRIDPSFRDQLLQLATNPDREPNLRISALHVASSKWPLESRPTLAHLLQSAQEPIMHHKAQQYLAVSEDPDALPLIEEFVLNRDPATAGSSLSKEYGILILRFRLEEEVLPLLTAVLRDESWPGEIQERAIDILANSGLSGGRAVLTGVRASGSGTLRSRIDVVLGEEE